MASEARDSKKTRRRRLSLRKKLAFAAVTFLILVVATLVGLEVLLYALNPSAPLKGVRGGVVYTWGHKVVNNRLGFRERDFETPKPAGVYRVMVLGDSLTWGAGLSRQQRYSARLEALLQEEHPEKRIEVLNFGVSGGPTVGQRDVLRKHVDAVDPDLVLVGFCINDTQPRGQRYCVEGRKYEFLFATFRRLRNVGLCRSSAFLDRRLANFLVATGLTPTWQVALQRTYEPDSPEWREFVEALDDIQSLCDRRDLPPAIFALLNQGTSTTRPTDYNHPDEELKLYLRWYHQAERAAAAAGMVTVHFEEEFKRQLTDVPMAVNPLDGHPSAACNDIYARKLEELVSPMVTPPAARLSRRPD